MELNLVQHVLPGRKELSTGAAACAGIGSAIAIHETAHPRHSGPPMRWLQKG